MCNYKIRINWLLKQHRCRAWISNTTSKRSIAVLLQFNQLTVPEIVLFLLSKENWKKKLLNCGDWDINCGRGEVGGGGEGGCGFFQWH